MTFNGLKKSENFCISANRNADIENITSHKISVVVFIREFILLKNEVPEYSMGMAPKFRKDFCMLVLKLIQCPDLEFKELEALFTSGKYNLLSDHLQNFCATLKRMYEEGLNTFLDSIFDTYEKLINDPREVNVCVINRSSVVGLYLRRIVLYLNKLSFAQVTSVYRYFCSYYERGRPGSLVRSLSKDKLNSLDFLLDYPMTSEEKRFQQSMEGSKKKLNLDRDNVEHCQWSRKQAELFTAQQASLLQSNEPQALHPALLQETIFQILKDNPDYADAHFLSYLNCLRERELCGAIDSLYGCFDRSIGSIKVSSGCNSISDRNKGFRYASLNLAILHAQFGHKEQALTSLKEAMVMAQEAGDNLCLQQAAGWAQKVDGGSNRFWPPTRTLKSTASCARHRAALAAQSYVQHSVSRKILPCNLFNLLIKGDVIHCQHSMTDLVQISLANRAVLWSLYGKMEMSSLCCQLLLNLNTGGEWESEAACLAACGTAHMLAIQGEHASAAAILHHAQIRAPRPPHCLLWMRTQYIITAMYSLHSDKWQEAEQAANRLASIDRWESQLIKAELHFLKCEPVYAMACLKDIFDNCQDENKLYLMLKIKAMVLAAQIENSCSGIHSVSSTNITLLNEALSLAKCNYLYYQAAIIEMNVANIQLQLGCITSALAIVQRVLAVVMAHGGPFDQARGLLLYIKCRIASAPKTGEKRKKVLILCTDLLERVKSNFRKVDATSRIKDVIYLQAQLYNEIGNHTERNKRALEYRQMDEERPTKLTNSLLTCF